MTLLTWKRKIKHYIKDLILKTWKNSLSKIICGQKVKKICKKNTFYYLNIKNCWLLVKNQKKINFFFGAFTWNHPYPTPPYILTLVTWVKRTQVWPLANSARVAGLWPIWILQCAALRAAGCYNWPCGPTKNLFILSPACILDGRAQLYSYKLSYSFCILLHHLS